MSDCYDANAFVVYIKGMFNQENGSAVKDIVSCLMKNSELIIN